MSETDLHGILALEQKPHGKDVKQNLKNWHTTGLSHAECKAYLMLVSNVTHLAWIQDENSKPLDSDKGDLNGHYQLKFK
jgi:hypothetical protein